MLKGLMMRVLVGCLVVTRGVRSGSDSGGASGCTVYAVIEEEARAMKKRMMEGRGGISSSVWIVASGIVGVGCIAPVVARAGCQVAQNISPVFPLELCPVLYNGEDVA